MSFSSTKLSLALVVGALAPLFSITTPALSGERPWYGASPPVGVYEERLDHEAHKAPAGEGYGDFGSRRRFYAPWGVPGRLRDAERPDPAPGSATHAEHLPGFGYQPDSDSSLQMPYRDRGSDLRGGPVGPPVGTGGLPGRSSMRGGLPPAAARGYRFRGDGPAGFGGWDTAPSRDGYRFRPLTKQEQQRREAGTGWRPRETERSGRQQLRTDRLPGEEAYGYESEIWFRRYYGEGP
jgi:hypothetical protein